MSTKIPQALIDDLAKEEVNALLEGLNDAENRKNPAFLAKVRQFLKDNNFITASETDGVKEVVNLGTTIPDLVEEEDGHVDSYAGRH